MPLVLLLSIPAFFVLFFRPVLRRLAFRNATRRPRETALIILGAMLGTAIITGSLIVGDTLRASIRHTAFTQLGPVDEVVQARGADKVPVLEGIAARLPSGPTSDIDGTLTAITLRAAVSTPAGVGRRSQPKAEIYETDFDKARVFGGDTGATGMSGATPQGDQVVLGKDLARTLDAKPGDRVELHAYGLTKSFSVARILPRTGVAGLLLDSRGSSSPTMFVAPGTLAALATEAGTTASTGGPGSAVEPPTSLLLVSNKGGVIDGAKRSDAVQAEIVAAVGGEQASSSTAKHDLLEAADDNGKQFTQLFSGIGFFSVAAGIILLVTIFQMLAEERKTEMGMLRAVGLKRSSLVMAFGLEGWMYAIAAAIVGSVAGIGVGRGIVFVAKGLFAQDVFGNGGLDLVFTARPVSLQGGFAAGFVVSAFTVVAMAFTTSRLNVIRAIRDLPEPPSTAKRAVRRSIVGWVVALIGAGILAGGISGDAGVAVLIGPAFLAVGVYWGLAPHLGRRQLGTVISIVLIAWEVFAFDIFSKAFDDQGIAVFVAQGLVLTAGAVVLLSLNQDVVSHAVRTVGGGQRNMSLRLGLAYPLARKMRTALVLSTYALVVFILAFLTVMSGLFAGQVTEFTQKISGGSSIRLESNATDPVPAAEVRSTPGVSGVAVLASARRAEFAAAISDGKFQFWPTGATTYDEQLVKQGVPALSHRDPKYADDAAAYQDLIDTPGLIIASRFFLVADSAGPPGKPLEVGDPVQMRDPLSGKTTTLHVAAISEAGFGNLLAMVSPATVRETFGDAISPNLLYIATAPGADAVAIAAQLNGRYVTNGVDARTFHDLIADNMSFQQQFFTLMRGYLALGLVVGTAGLGVVAVRAVRERRRQVGVLRSIGFPGIAVRRAFMAESTFVALEGVMTGVVLAIIASWRLATSGTFGAGLEYSLPWIQLLTLVGGTLVAALIATVVPAIQASRIRPAVALRMTD